MKTRANYSVEKDIKDKFDIFCKENAINKSALIERFLMDYIKKGEKQ